MNIYLVCAPCRCWAWCLVRRNGMKASFHWEREGWWVIWVSHLRNLTLTSRYRYRWLPTGSWGASRGRIAAATGNVLQTVPPDLRSYLSALRGSLLPKESHFEAADFANLVWSSLRVWGRRRARWWGFRFVVYYPGHPCPSTVECGECSKSRMRMPSPL